MLESQIIKKFIDTFSHIDYGTIEITMPDGKKYDFAGQMQGANANLVIHSISAIKAFAKKGDIGFAESYRDGLWDSDNLTQLFLLGLQNETVLDRYIYGGFFARLTTRFIYFLNRNTITKSRHNIHSHYDLGNDFYSLWLDSTMTYSSALFENQHYDLASAQYNKYDRIIERLSTSGTLLEIGCGWGGFAKRALSKGDYNIKGITISEEQYDFATKLLKGDAAVAFEDYRIQKGKYDQIVSIEMFEAVGEKFWPIYFSKIKSLLSKGGTAMIQTICIKDEYFKRYRKGGDPIRSFIFPVGMLASPQQFLQASNREGLSITNWFAFGKDYALTLKHWLTQFEQRLNEIKALGFDEPFIRLWKFYLACCIASFTVDRTDVIQIELRHAH